MRLLYSKPHLYDLSQGSRISFARQFRHMTQDELSDALGITGENKRRTMTRYERGERNPKEDRLEDISRILITNIDLIKNYDFKDSDDIIYFLLWLEEYYPGMRIDLNLKPNDRLNSFVKEWNEMKKKREIRKISYEDYIEWKLNYILKEE